MKRKLNKKKTEIILRCDCPNEINDLGEKFKQEFESLHLRNQTYLKNIENRLLYEIEHIKKEVEKGLKITEEIHERNPVFRTLCKLGFIKYKPIEEDQK